MYASHKIEGSTIRVKFHHTHGGLASRDGQPLSHFEIAGIDGSFVPATAKIDGDSVVLSATQVPKPKQVRFRLEQAGHA